MIITADKDNFKLRLLWLTRQYIVVLIISSLSIFLKGRLSNNDFFLVLTIQLIVFSTIFYFVTYKKNIFYLKSILFENDTITLTIMKYDKIDSVTTFSPAELDLEMLSEYSLKFFPKNYVVDFKKREIKKEFTIGRNKGTTLWIFEKFFSQRNYGFWTGAQLKTIVELISKMKNKEVNLDWVK
ncbi:hypothetical protein BH10BAC1_BH10BAC1_14630 [soil metagenome]